MMMIFVEDVKNFFKILFGVYARFVSSKLFCGTAPLNTFYFIYTNY